MIVTDAARSGAHIFQDPADVNRKDTDMNIPWDGKNSRRSPRLTSLVLIGGGTTVSPNRTDIQETSSTKGPTVPVEVRNSQIFNTSINGDSAKNGDTTPTFSKAIGPELSDDSIADIYSLCLVKFMRDAVVTASPKFMNLGLSSVHTLDELGSFRIPVNRIRRPADGSNWLTPGNLIGEVTAARMRRMRSDKNYIPQKLF